MRPYRVVCLMPARARGTLAGVTCERACGTQAAVAPRCACGVADCAFGGSDALDIDAICLLSYYGLDVCPCAASANSCS